MTLFFMFNFCIPRVVRRGFFFHDFFDFSGFCCILDITFQNKRLFIYKCQGRNNHTTPPQARQSKREI